MLFSLVQRIRRISRRLQVKPDNVSGQRNIYRWHTHYSLLLFLAFPPLSPSARQKISNAFLSLGKTLFWSAQGSLLWLSFKRVSFLNSFLSVMLSDMLLSEKADKQTNYLTGERQEIFRMIASQSHMFSSLFLSLSLMSVFLSSSAD